MSPSYRTCFCLCFTLFPPAAPGPARFEHLPGPLPLGQLLLADRQGQLQPHLLPSLLPLAAPLLPRLIHVTPPRPLSWGSNIPPPASRAANRPTLRTHPGESKAKGFAQELQREKEVSDLKWKNIKWEGKAK